MLTFYHTLAGSSRGVGEKVGERPQWFGRDEGVLGQAHGRAGRRIEHPAGHLQQLKPSVTLECSIDVGHALARIGPIDGHLEAVPRMPRVADLELGTMCFVLRGCTIGNAGTPLWATSARSNMSSDC